MRRLAGIILFIFMSSLFLLFQNFSLVSQNDKKPLLLPDKFNDFKSQSESQKFITHKDYEGILTATPLYQKLMQDDSFLNIQENPSQDCQSHTIGECLNSEINLSHEHNTFFGLKVDPLRATAKLSFSDDLEGEYIYNRNSFLIRKKLSDSSSMLLNYNSDQPRISFDIKW